MDMIGQDDKFIQLDAATMIRNIQPKRSGYSSLIGKINIAVHNFSQSRLPSEGFNRHKMPARAGVIKTR
jgi:hypothetical protein